MDFTIGRILLLSAGGDGDSGGDGDANSLEFELPSSLIPEPHDLYPISRECFSEQRIELYSSIIVYMGREGLSKISLTPTTTNKMPSFSSSSLSPPTSIPQPKRLFFTNLKKETISKEAILFYKEFSNNISLVPSADLSYNLLLKAMVEKHLHLLRNTQTQTQLAPPPLTISLFNKAYQEMVSIYRKKSQSQKERDCCDFICSEVVHLYHCSKDDRTSMSYIDGHFKLFTSLSPPDDHSTDDGILCWRISLYWMLAKRLEKDHPSNLFFFLASKIAFAASTITKEQKKQIYQTSFHHYLSMKGRHPRLAMQIAKMLCTVEDSLPKKIKLLSLIADSYGFGSGSSGGGCVISEWPALLEENLVLLLELLLLQEFSVSEQFRPLLVRSLFRLLRIRQLDFIVEFERILDDHVLVDDFINKLKDHHQCLGVIDEVTIEERSDGLMISSLVPLRIRNIVFEDLFVDVSSKIGFGGGGGKIFVPTTEVHKTTTTKTETKTETGTAAIVVFLLENGKEFAVQCNCKEKDVFEFVDGDDDVDDGDDDDDATVKDTEFSIIKTPTVETVLAKEELRVLDVLLKRHSIVNNGQLICHRKIIDVKDGGGGCGIVELVAEWKIYNLGAEDLSDLVVEFKNTTTTTTKGSFFSGMRKSNVSLLRKDQEWTTRTTSLVFNYNRSDGDDDHLLPIIVIRRLDSLSLIIDLITE